MPIFMLDDDIERFEPAVTGEERTSLNPVVQGLLLCQFVLENESNTSCSLVRAICFSSNNTLSLHFVTVLLPSRPPNAQKGLET